MNTRTWSPAFTIKAHIALLISSAVALISLGWRMLLCQNYGPQYSSFFFLFIYFYPISKSRRPWVSQVSHFFQSSRNLEVVLIPTTRVTQRYTCEPRTKVCERSLSCGKTTIQRLMYRHNGGEIGYRICQNSLSSC